MQSIYTIEVFYSFSILKVFEIQCLFYTQSRSQFGLDTFQVLSSHWWLMATVLDSTRLESNSYL